MNDEFTEDTQPGGIGDPEHASRTIAKVLLAYLEAMTKVAASTRDPEAYEWLAQLRDELKPELDWVIRNGRWFREP